MGIASLTNYKLYIIPLIGKYSFQTQQYFPRFKPGRLEDLYIIWKWWISIFFCRLLL